MQTEKLVNLKVSNDGVISDAYFGNKKLFKKISFSFFIPELNQVFRPIDIKEMNISTFKIENKTSKRKEEIFMHSNIGIGKRGKTKIVFSIIITIKNKTIVIEQRLRSNVKIILGIKTAIMFDAKIIKSNKALFLDGEIPIDNNFIKILSSYGGHKIHKNILDMFKNSKNSKKYWEIYSNNKNFNVITIKIKEDENE